MLCTCVHPHATRKLHHVLLWQLEILFSRLSQHLKLFLNPHPPSTLTSAPERDSRYTRMSGRTLLTALRLLGSVCPRGSLLSRHLLTNESYWNQLRPRHVPHCTALDRGCRAT